MSKIAKLPSRIIIKNNHIPQVTQGHAEHIPTQSKGNYFYNWNVNGSTDYSYNIDLIGKHMSKVT